MRAERLDSESFSSTIEKKPVWSSVVAEAWGAAHTDDKTAMRLRLHSIWGAGLRQ